MNKMRFISSFFLQVKTVFKYKAIHLFYFIFATFRFLFENVFRIKFYNSVEWIWFQKKYLFSLILFLFYLLIIIIFLNFFFFFTTARFFWSFD